MVKKPRKARHITADQQYTYIYVPKMQNGAVSGKAADDVGVMTAASITSLFSLSEASAAASTTSFGSSPSSTIGSPSVSLFLVSVPVLSEHRISTPAISSMEARRDTMAFSLESASAPRAIVMEKTAGIATGIEATSRISTNCRISSASARPQVSATTMSRQTWTATITTASTTATAIRKLPIWNMDEDLSGLNIGLLIEIPGLMARGNWKAAVFIDERASDAAFDGLVKIFSGQARGTTGLFKVLVSEFLGAERAPVSYTNEGKTRRLVVGKAIKGEVVPVPGAKPGEDIVISNTEYWMGPDITVATATQGRVRAYGRVWDFDGRSAEICQIDWSGPAAEQAA